MKPEFESRRLLSNTQAKAKMYEFDVPIGDHVNVPVSPTRLFPLTIGNLGEIAARINDGDATEEELKELQDNLLFLRVFSMFLQKQSLTKNIPSIFVLRAQRLIICVTCRAVRTFWQNKLSKSPIWMD